jgi:hypothetical protein
MRFKDAIDRLDDESGSLARAYSKLEMERDHGLPSGAEVEDFLWDLFEAARCKYIHPWKTRSILAASGAGLLLLVSCVLPHLVELPQALVLGMWMTAGIAAVWAAFALMNYTRLQSRLEDQYEKLRLARSCGATLLDLEEVTNLDLS